MEENDKLKAYEKLAAVFGTTPEELYTKANKPTAGSQKVPEDLMEILSDLSSKERDVLVLLFGLDGSPKRTPEEIGELYGVDKNEILNIAKQAITKLKNAEK